MATQTTDPGRSGGLSAFLANTRRIGGIAGILFVVVFIAGILVQGDTPMLEDDADEIRAFFADSDDSNLYLVGDWLTGVAFVLFFLPFISALRSVLGPADPSGGMWARLAFIGGVLMLAFGAASSMAFGALALTQAEALDDSTLLFANGISQYGFGSAVPLGMVAFLLPASLVIVASGVLWRWLGIFGLVLALLAIVGALWVVDGDQTSGLGILGILAFIGFGVWVLITSVGMLMADRRDRAPMR